MKRKRFVSKDEFEELLLSEFSKIKNNLPPKSRAKIYIDGFDNGSRWAFKLCRQRIKEIIKSR